MDRSKRFWPRIEHRRKQITTVVDSLMVVFFLDPSACNDVAPPRRAFAEFLSGIGRGRLNFIVDMEGETIPLPPSWMSVIEERVVEPTLAGELVDIVLLDTERSGHQCKARYYHDPTAPSLKWPDERSFIYFRVPHVALSGEGMDELQQFVQFLTGFLPFSYGYVSPALSYDNFFADTLSYVHRYPGFDVASPTAVAADIGDAPLGAYWMNFFGPRLSRMLGGMKGLRANLPPEIQVAPLENGSVYVRIGDIPDVGDVNRSNTLPLYHQLASVLGPHMRVPKVIYFKDEHGMADKVAQEAWHHRFLAA